MSTNISVSPSGIITPQTSEIKEGFQEIFVNAFGSDLNLDDATPQGVLIDDLTQEKQLSNSLMMYIFNQLNPETAEGIFQDALAKLYFIERKAATRSIVNCVCTGLAGTVLNGVDSGNPALAQSVNGDIFECVTGGTIPASGSITLAFRSQETGEIPVTQNTVNRVYQTILGWDSVNNASTGTMGSNEETRAEFAKRMIDSLAINATGSLSALQSSIANLDGVTDYKLWENVTDSSVTVRGVTLNPHSVWICVNSAVGSDEMAETIYKNKSAGADTNGSQLCSYIAPDTNVAYAYYYDNPTDQDIYVKVTTVSEPSDEVEDAIKEAIVDNFQGKSNEQRISIGDSILASRFVADIVELTDIVNVKISTDGVTWADSLSFNMNILPTISAENVSVVQ